MWGAAQDIVQETEEITASCKLASVAWKHIDPATPDFSPKYRLVAQLIAQHTLHNH